MDKELLRTIIDKYQKAEESVSKLDREFGINIWNSANENFYNKYNYIIFKLFNEIYGDSKRELIEDYIFKQVDMTFDEGVETSIVYDNMTFDELFNHLNS